MNQTNMSFDAAFQALTDYSPLRWQHRLYEDFLQSRLKKACDLPTGLGKTSVIPIWLIALATQAEGNVAKLPRRLIYIVNRRTVVDQATGIVEKIRHRLLKPEDSSWTTHSHVLKRLASALRKLSAGFDDLPLAISTLRGELADNEEWKADPASPAIIIGTIDMIGSKLLFSGYGDGRYHRPHHAGLIGQEALIIHDEAHLTPAFGDLLRNISEAQRREIEPCLSEVLRPVEVMELSATRRGDNAGVFTLEAEDEQDTIVQQRLDAKKYIWFCKDIQKEAFVATLVEKAKKYETSSAKVLIFVRSPETAQKVVSLLTKELGRGSVSRIALLTGTMRGHERDVLVQENVVYKALLDHEMKVQQTVYLVSTSAGEVGIDIDADHLVCDLTSLDSMIQRLGRVNRRGGNDRVATVDIVLEKAEKKDGGDEPSEKDSGKNSDSEESKGSDKDAETPIDITRKILSQLPRNDDDSLNASPRNLRELLKDKDEAEKSKAYSPKPPVPPLTDIQLDAWSLTSIMQPLPGRPEVAPFLHGLTNDPPETRVVWRKEVILLDKAGSDEEALRDWFRACRIETRERLRDRTSTIQKALKKLLDEHQKKDKKLDFPVILLDDRGEAERHLLSEVTRKNFILNYRTVVLPLEAGGLMKPYGTLDGRVVDTADDVADTSVEKEVTGRRGRWLFIKTAGGESWVRLLTGETTPPPNGLREIESITLQAAAEGAEDESEERFLVLMGSPRGATLENPEIARIEQTLIQHSGDIGDHVKRIAEALKLYPELQSALAIAATLHDQGKGRQIWQYFARNNDQSNLLAKSTKYRHWRVLGGFRHEFGSLLDAANDSNLKNHPYCDLILHLIASHHGWARPHFEPGAFDHSLPYTTDDNEIAAAEVMRRFGRLQQAFGHWGLAWFESLLRCADIAASKQAIDTVPTPKAEEVHA